MRSDRSGADGSAGHPSILKVWLFPGTNRLYRQVTPDTKEGTRPDSVTPFADSNGADRSTGHTRGSGYGAPRDPPHCRLRAERNSTPYTLLPTPYTLHHTCCTLQRTPCTLQPTRWTFAGTWIRRFTRSSRLSASRRA